MGYVNICAVKGASDGKLPVSIFASYILFQEVRASPHLGGHVGEHLASATDLFLAPLW
jgi:hypothetical protein